MRGADITQENLFSTVHLDTYVPSDHPLRSVRRLFNKAMKRIDWLLDGAYSERGRESTLLNASCGPCYCKCFSASAASGN